MDLNSIGEKLGRQTLGESHDGNNINELSGDTVHIPDSGPNTCKKYSKCFLCIDQNGLEENVKPFSDKTL